MSQGLRAAPVPDRGLSDAQGVPPRSLTAQSVTAWSKIRAGMAVHAWGVLAVPANSFLHRTPRSRTALLQKNVLDCRRWTTRADLRIAIEYEAITSLAA